MAVGGIEGRWYQRGQPHRHPKAGWRGWQESERGRDGKTGKTERAAEDKEDGGTTGKRPTGDKIVYRQGVFRRINGTEGMAEEKDPLATTDNPRDAARRARDHRAAASG